MENIDLLNLEKPIRPSGFWNNINPWSKANKEFRKQQKLWTDKNSTHYDKINYKMQNVIKNISHLIGVAITLFFATSPWLMPKIPTNLGVGHYIENGYYFSWPDYVTLTIVPLGGHYGVNLSTKLGHYGKVIKYSLIIIPIILTAPYLIYQQKQKTLHKKYCETCKIHNLEINSRKE